MCLYGHAVDVLFVSDWVITIARADGYSFEFLPFILSKYFGNESGVFEAKDEEYDKGDEVNGSSDNEQCQGSSPSADGIVKTHNDNHENVSSQILFGFG